MVLSFFFPFFPTSPGAAETFFFLFPLRLSSRTKESSFPSPPPSAPFARFLCRTPSFARREGRFLFSFRREIDKPFPYLSSLSYKEIDFSLLFFPRQDRVFFRPSSFGLEDSVVVPPLPPSLISTMLLFKITPLFSSFRELDPFLSTPKVERKTEVRHPSFFFSRDQGAQSGRDLDFGYFPFPRLEFLFLSPHRSHRQCGFFSFFPYRLTMMRLRRFFFSCMPPPPILETEAPCPVVLTSPFFFSTFPFLSSKSLPPQSFPLSLFSVPRLFLFFS